MFYANVAGERRRAIRGLEGSCPTCGGTLIAKCGNVNVWHWAHSVSADCDRWAEPVGPWHWAWQQAIAPRWIEVPWGPHRADIVGDDDVIIELQHSAISTEEIAAREDFYGDMIWLFDATHRFRVVRSGEWAFFALGRVKHLSNCRRPVYLDFGSHLVEVSLFTSAIPEIHGIGVFRERSWFCRRYLASVLTGEVGSARSSDVHPDPWLERCPHRPIDFPTKWYIDGEPKVVPAGTTFIPLAHNETRSRASGAERLIETVTDLANGWTATEMNEMRRFFCGTPMIFEGLLRVLPALPGDRSWREWTPPLAIHSLMDKAEGHIRAGRLPVLKDTTRRAILERTIGR